MFAATDNRGVSRSRRSIGRDSISCLLRSGQRRRSCGGWGTYWSASFFGWAADGLTGCFDRVRDADLGFGAGGCGRGERGACPCLGTAGEAGSGRWVAGIASGGVGTRRFGRETV